MTSKMQPETNPEYHNRLVQTKMMVTQPNKIISHQQLVHHLEFIHLDKDHKEEMSLVAHHQE